jgi:hypothetical protein
LDEVRCGFQPVFAWMPDLHGIVDRWGAADNVVFIEFRLRGTIGGKPFEWPVVDRFTLRQDGLATERVSYFDALPVLAAAARRPSGWRRLSSMDVGRRGGDIPPSGRLGGARRVAARSRALLYACDADP